MARDRARQRIRERAYWRRMHGWPADALGVAPLPRGVRRQPDPTTLSARAAAAGLSVHTVMQRKRRGWPAELWFIPAGTLPRTDTVTAKAARAGLTYRTVKERRERGWTLLEALTTPRGERPPRLAARPRRRRVRK